MGPVEGREPGHLSQLRRLKSEGSPEELSELINHLKQTGYPKSILSVFTPDCSKRGNRGSHPYQYDWQESTRDLGHISPSSLVSVIVVAYNSGNTLPALLKTLEEQSYKNLELIIINNSTEDISPLLAAWGGRLQYLEAANPGFAEANNIGLESASGDLLLILNPDTELHKESIKELVHAMEIDCTAAATIPKIYFSRPFYKVTFTSKAFGFAIDIGKTIQSLSYKKMFVRQGDTALDGIVTSGQSNLISLDIAFNVESSYADIEIWSLDSGAEELCINIEIEGSGATPILFTASSHRRTIRLNLSERSHCASRYLINNVGSDFRDDNMEPYDIGFGEVDIGQFSSRAYRNALCGCCALLRRDLFIQRKIFVSEFFSYYEDTELSQWITRNKMHILYVPSAVIYHRHSETTEESSPLWAMLVGRSYNLFKLARQADSDSPLSVEYKVCSDLAERYFGLINTLSRYDRELEGKSLTALIERSSKLKVAFYNSYWETLGGGERHALDLAEMAINKGCEVYLISEKDFSINNLRNYFNVKLEGAKRLVTGTVSESLTQRFDIFINSTYGSPLISHALVSYYIVSFPQRVAEARFLSSYTFLHNSEYTSEWAYRYWGEHKSQTLLPVLSFNHLTGSSPDSADITSLSESKEYLIISVGRFNFSGHCKNQHIIASIFSRLLENGVLNSHWNLTIAGSLDSTSESSIRHYETTKKCLSDTNSEVIANASIQTIQRMYTKAAIYIHAAGLGVDPIAAPEKNEHFGISPFQSLVNGCLLLAYNNGGPAMMIRNSQVGRGFKDENELEKSLVYATRLFECESGYERRKRIQICKAITTSAIDHSVLAAESLFGTHRKE